MTSKCVGQEKQRFIAYIYSKKRRGEPKEGEMSITFGRSFPEFLHGANVQRDEKSGLSKVSIARCDHPGIPSTAMLLKWLSQTSSLNQNGCLHCALHIEGGASSKPHFTKEEEEEEAADWMDEEEEVKLLPKEMIEYEIVGPELEKALGEEDLEMVYRFNQDPFFHKMLKRILEKKIKADPLFPSTIPRYITNILKKRAAQAMLILLYAGFQTGKDSYAGWFSQSSTEAYASLSFPYHLWSDTMKTRWSRIDSENPFNFDTLCDESEGVILHFYHAGQKIYILQYAPKASFLELPADISQLEATPLSHMKLPKTNGHRVRIHSVVQANAAKAFCILLKQVLKRVESFREHHREKGWTIDVRDDPWFALHMIKERRRDMTPLLDEWFSNTSQFYKKIGLDRKRHWGIRPLYETTSTVFTHIPPEEYKYMMNDPFFVDLDDPSSV